MAVVVGQRAPSSIVPTLRMERALLRAGVDRLICVDEVGRGALAGPVTVGVTVIDLRTASAPKGLRDSKLLTPQARAQLAPKLRRWAPASAVGHADAAEIDEIGIINALRVAAARAMAVVDPIAPAAQLALLDGNHDWLNEPDESEFLFPDPRRLAARALADLRLIPSRVVTRIKADLSCAGVAAASVLAKCERDSIMVGLAERHPEYDWEHNKGYGAPEHVAALRRMGPSALHRNSWNLPDCQSAVHNLAPGSGSLVG